MHSLDVLAAKVQEALERHEGLAVSREAEACPFPVSKDDMPANEVRPARPDVLFIPNGVVLAIASRHVPDWGARFAAGTNLEHEDGLALDRADLRRTLELERYGQLDEDPDFGGDHALAWAFTLTPRGNLAQARIATLLRLAKKRKWEADGLIQVPRRGVWMPYNPDQGFKLDKRPFKDVSGSLDAIKPLQASS